MLEKNKKHWSDNSNQTMVEFMHQMVISYDEVFIVDK